MDTKPITVQVTVNATIEKTWSAWTNPENIKGWAFADDTWEAPAAENDLRVGGRFKTTMAAKDKSAGFDFTGTYTAVKKHELIEYDIDGDKRHVKVQFDQTPEGVKVTETFDPETENTHSKQREGWQGILSNFKKFVEQK